MPEQPGRVTTTKEFDARLAKLRETGGDLADYESGLHALASSLDKPIGTSALLKLSRLGWDSYCRPALVRSAAPPRFLGRPAALSSDPLQADASGAARSMRSPVGGVDRGPRTAPAEGESPVAYAQHLKDHLVRFLDAAGISEDDADLLPVYACYLAREDVRQRIGWQRSQDLHALAMLLHERVVVGAGFGPAAAEVEEALFRWVHLATHAQVGSDDLAEQSARREIRLAHAQQPSADVAVLTCEVPLTDDMGFEQLSDHLQDVGFSREHLLAIFRARSTKNAKWAAHYLELHDPGRLDLAGRAATERHDLSVLASHAHGHLLRWLLDHDVTVSSLLLSLCQEYARGVVRSLGRQLPQGEPKHSLVAAHLSAMVRLRREVRVRLPDELLLLAWLCDQAAIGFRLESFLGAREQVMARMQSVER
jgi:hypothetical protein